MPFNPKFRTILPLIIASLIMAAAFSALPASADRAPKPRGGSCQNWQEKAWNDSYCAQLGGRREVRHYYVYPDGSGFILIDCETDSEVIEGGLDKRTSLDSVQQALFASKLTGKVPKVAIYDSDGKAGKYEHRIEIAARRAGVGYTNPSCQ